MSYYENTCPECGRFYSYHEGTVCVPKLPVGINTVGKSDVDQMFLDWVEWSKKRPQSPLNPTADYTGTDSVFVEWTDWVTEQRAKELLARGVKCECGVVITMGDAYSKVSDYHSDYCPCSKLPKMQVPDEDK